MTASTSTALRYVLAQREAVWITGADGLDFLRRLTTGRLGGLEHGAGTPTVLLSDDGRAVDLLAAHQGPDGILLLTSGPGAATVVADALRQYVLYGDDVRVTPAHDQVSVHTAFVLPPTTADDRENLLQDNSDANLAHLDADAADDPEGAPAADSAHPAARLADALGLALDIETQSAAPGAWLARASDSEPDESLVWLLRHPKLAGVGGWDVVVPVSARDEIAGRLDSSGFALASASDYATARIAATSPAFGHEIQPGGPNPLELGLGEAVDTDKGCYVGQEVVARLDTYDKVQRRLVRWHADTADTADTAETPASPRSAAVDPAPRPVPGTPKSPANSLPGDPASPTQGWTLHPAQDVTLRGRYTHGTVTTAVGPWGLGLVPSGLLGADRVIARPPIVTETTGHPPGSADGPGAANGIVLRITPVP